jgi:ribonucleoside-diphosphate reductase alpha chain
MQTNKDNELTDMDKVDMLSEVIEEFGGAEDLVQSNEFQEVVGDTDMQVQEENTEDLSQEVTQEGVEADSAGEGKATHMGDGENVKERPKVAQGTTQEIETAYGDLFVTINNSENNGPFEVFANLGKSGGYTQSFTQALGRITSLALRSGATGEDVIKQLDDIRSPQIAWDQGTQIHSVPDAIAEAMKRHMQVQDGEQQTVDQYETPAQKTEKKGQTQPKTETEQKADSGDTAEIIQEGDNPECPDCGGMLVLQEGCKTCPDCGWSKC